MLPLNKKKWLNKQLTFKNSLLFFVLSLGALIWSQNFKVQAFWLVLKISRYIVLICGQNFKILREFFLSIIYRNCNWIKKKMNIDAQNVWHLNFRNIWVNCCFLSADSEQTNNFLWWPSYIAEDKKLRWPSELRTRSY